MWTKLSSINKNQNNNILRVSRRNITNSHNSVLKPSSNYNPDKEKIQEPSWEQISDYLNNEALPFVTRLKDSILKK